MVTEPLLLGQNELIAALPQISDLIRSGFTATEAAEKYLIPDLEERARAGAVISWVVYDGHDIVGHAAIKDALFEDYPVAYLGTLVVREDYRRQGLGSRLAEARVRYLDETNFVGTALSHPLTSHLGSQGPLQHCGFVAEHLRLGWAGLSKDLPQRDSTVGVVKLYRAPTTHNSLSLYVPDEYKLFTGIILNNLSCDYDFREIEQKEPSEIVREKYSNDGLLYLISLDSVLASADIEFILSQGNHYFAGVEVRCDRERVRVFAELLRKPRDALQRKHVHVIDQYREVVDFVWEQYVRTGTR